MTFPTTRCRLRVGALAVPVVAAIGLALPAVGGAHSAHSAARPLACTTSQLVPTVGSPNGAAGTIYLTLTFSNVGSACTLRGYPRVLAVARDGQRVGNAARISIGTKGGTITLRRAHGGDFPQATATLGIIDTGALPHCHAVPAVALKITPPGQTTSTTVPLPFEACGRGPSVLKISPVKR